MDDQDIWELMRRLFHKRHYDRKGQPIDLMRWAELKNDPEYYRVSESEVHLVRVSTVWIGINHNFGQGPPLIFETMTFADDEHHPWDEWCWRYATVGQAIEGHKLIEQAIQQGKLPHDVETQLESL